MYIKAGETYTVSDERMSLEGMRWSSRIRKYGGTNMKQLET